MSATGDRCSDFNISESIRIAVGTVGVASCSLSLVGCFCAIAIIVIYKKYIFSVQRLFLYSAICVMIDISSQLVQRVLLLMTDDAENVEDDVICKVAGFMAQYAAMAIMITVSCVMFELVMGVFYSFETGKKANVVYILLVFVFPLTINWIPFTVHAYGSTTWHCEIMIQKNCTVFEPGLILASFLWWMPLYLSILFVILSYVAITVKLLYDKHRYTAMIELDRNQVYQNTYNDIMYLKYYPIIYMIINILPIASNLYDSTHHNHPFQPIWIVSAIIRGLQGGFIILAAVIDPKTRKRLTYKQLKAAFIQNVLKRDIAEEYPIINGDVSDSLHPSYDI